MRRASLIPLLAGSLVLLLVAAIAIPGLAERSSLAANGLVLAAGLLAITACVLTARREGGYVRRFWLLVGLAYGFGTAGQAVYTYYENILNGPRPAASLLDVVFFAYYVPLLVAVLFLYEDEKEPRLDWARILDLAQMGIVCLSVYLYIAVTAATKLEDRMQQVGSLYETADLILLGLVLLRTFGASTRLEKRLFGAMSISVGAYALGDTISIQASLHSPDAPARWLSFCYLLPLTVVSVVAAMWRSPKEESQEIRPIRSFGLARYLAPAVGPLWMVLVAMRMDRFQHQLAVSALALSFGCYLARLVAALYSQGQTSEQLASGEQRFRTIIEKSSEAIALLDEQRRILELSGASERLLGYSVEERVGRPATEGVHPDDLPRMLGDFKRLGKEIGASVQGEYRCFHKAGHWVWIQLVATNLLADPHVGAILVNFRDVSEIKQAEAEHKSTEERFSKAFHANSNAMSISQLHDGRVIDVNEAWLQLGGFDREEVLGRRVEEVNVWVHPQQREKAVQQLAADGYLRDVEVEFRRKGGEVLCVLVSAESIELDGEPCILWVGQDVTARKRAEEALLESEERFRTLVENLNVAVVVTGTQAEVQFVNRVATEMFGMKEEEVLGKNSSQIGWMAIREDGTEIPFPQRPVPQVIETHRPIRNVVMGWRRSGSEDIFWVLGNFVPQFNEGGRLTRVITSFSNITERKETEEALRQLSTRLLRLQDEERRRLGRDLHDSLAQRVLAVNLNLARVSDSKSRMDKQSLRALAEARQMLQEMSQEIRTLSYLLHPPLLDELGLTSAIREYADGFSKRSGIQLTTDLPTGFGRLSQDAETALFRVVQESLSNIQRHSGSKTARILFSANSGNLILEVTDKGRGISKPASERGNGGAGSRLGVGILGMRERMKQLGGQLEIRSNESGTTVLATLPLLEAPHAATHPRG